MSNHVARFADLANLFWMVKRQKDKDIGKESPTGRTCIEIGQTIRVSLAGGQECPSELTVFDKEADIEAVAKTLIQ